MPCPESLRSTEQVTASLVRLQGLADQSGTVPVRRKRAEAAIALGELQRAEDILRGIYASDGASLACGLDLPQRELSALAAVASARSLEGGMPLVQRLAVADDRALAWRVLKPLLDIKGPSPKDELDRLAWALALSADQAPDPAHRAA